MQLRNHYAGMKLRKTLIVAGVSLTLALIFPELLFTIVAVNLITLITVMGLQVIVTRWPVEPLEQNLVANEPFVSIHVPAHNEPPELVEQTLESLARLNWSNYEVLVIDNNTSDPALWKPLERVCARLGNRFRFFHVENLAGYKAGAMNYVRKQMDSRAKFIFVVDADYVVQPDALKIAFKHHTTSDIGLIQFPQDYRNVTGANAGIALDYKHYFSGFMNVGNALRCVPSTGTMALVSADALEKIGGFGTDVITEDADLGFRLNLHGYRSIFVNEVIGSGLMPHELSDLKKQRWRWAFGNAQILRRNWRELVLPGALSLRQRIGFVSNFTAWFGFSLVPSLALVLLAFYSIVGALNIPQIYTVMLAGFSLTLHGILKYGVLHYSLRRDGHGLSDIWKAFTSHLGLGWVFNASWIRCLFVSDAPFVRTNKFIANVVPGKLNCTFVELALGASLLMAAGIFVFADYVLGPLGAMGMAGATLAIYWVAHQTEQTLRVTERLFAMAAEEPRTENQEAVREAVQVT